MREILFRAKHIHTFQKNKHLDGMWVYGYLEDEDYINSPELEGEFLIAPKTVCQYTGYVDLRKKKAFEHDIVFCEDTGKSGHIVFKDGQFLVEWEDDDSLRADIHFWFTERRVYIVGNIFDNPELIRLAGKDSGQEASQPALMPAT